MGATIEQLRRSAERIKLRHDLVLEHERRVDNRLMTRIDLPPHEVRRMARQLCGLSDEVRWLRARYMRTMVRLQKARWREIAPHHHVYDECVECGGQGRIYNEGGVDYPCPECRARTIEYRWA